MKSGFLTVSSVAATMAMAPAQEWLDGDSAVPD
jgi:hypothetical protein